MPVPGDLIEAFSPLPDRCFRMVQSRQLQATHCRGEPARKGVWKDRSGRSWYVEACRATRAEDDERGVGGFRTPCPSTQSGNQALGRVDDCPSSA